MRLRTQSKVMTYVKEHDPQTELTPWALRNMVISGEIPSVQVGRKRLIDLDTLDLYLSPPANIAPDSKPEYGTIRPVRIVK